MAGLKRSGVDANAFGSKFKDTSGGIDAGHGKRTYTAPAYTLFVVGVPDAEGSDSVEAVFRMDPGFMQCRPVGHKRSRRMCFIDYSSIEDATRGMRMHQGQKFEPADAGLSIDFDHDARQKRNTALDEGIFEKFFPCGPRVAQAEDEGALFHRLREDDLLSPALGRKAKAVHGKQAKAKAKAVVRARLQITRTDGGGEIQVVGADTPGAASGPEVEQFGGLVGYSSGSEAAEGEDQGHEEAEEEEDEGDEDDEDEEAEVHYEPVLAKRARV